MISLKIGVDIGNSVAPPLTRNVKIHGTLNDMGPSLLFIFKIYGSVGLEPPTIGSAREGKPPFPSRRRAKVDLGPKLGIPGTLRVIFANSFAHYLLVIGSNVCDYRKQRILPGHRAASAISILMHLSLVGHPLCFIDYSVLYKPSSLL